MCFFDVPRGTILVFYGFGLRLSSTTLTNQRSATGVTRCLSVVEGYFFNRSTFSHRASTSLSHRYNSLPERSRRLFFNRSTLSHQASTSLSHRAAGR
ncbi:MAG: hypothetical protein LBN27_05315 [Prevotellaceae bacterium]|nr:hypothetical protein [Prevotellaceae bacterium]